MYFELGTPSQFRNAVPLIQTHLCLLKSQNTLVAVYYYNYNQTVLDRQIVARNLRLLLPPTISH